MDPDLPSGLGGFFQGLLGDLLRLMRTDSPVQWDLATQLAQNIAADGASEPNVDPMERIRLEELSGIAELHVADVTGMAITPSGGRLTILPTGRAEWARRSLADWRPLIEQIASSVSPPAVPGAGGGRPGEDTGRSSRGSGGESRGIPGEGMPDGAADPGIPGRLGADGGSLSEPGEDDGGTADLSALISQWTTTLAPTMVAMQVGRVVGLLAQRALGQHELPLPRREQGQLLVVPANVAQFAEDWSLPIDDVRLWLLVRDLVAHTVLGRPFVRARIEAMLVEHARGIRPDPTLLDARLGDLGGLGGDLGDLMRLLGDPTALGQALDTPEARRVRAALSAAEAAISGYVEWVTDVVAARAIGARLPVSEAMRRRRVARSGDERAAEALFGLRLDQEQVDRGVAFIRGVVERAGQSELSKLWLVDNGLPTPSEIEAPGLWVERVNLPPLEGRAPPDLSGRSPPREVRGPIRDGNSRAPRRARCARGCAGIEDRAGGRG